MATSRSDHHKTTADFPLLSVSTSSLEPGKSRGCTDLGFMLDHRTLTDQLSRSRCNLFLFFLLFSFFFVPIFVHVSMKETAMTSSPCHFLQHTEPPLIKVSSLAFQDGY